jgi:hypothetical protein
MIGDCRLLKLGIPFIRKSTINNQQSSIAIQIAQRLLICATEQKS